HRPYAGARVRRRVRPTADISAGAGHARRRGNLAPWLWRYRQDLPRMDRWLSHLPTFRRRRAGLSEHRDRVPAEADQLRAARRAAAAITAASVAPNKPSNSRRSAMSTCGIVTGCPRSARLVT